MKRLAFLLALTQVAFAQSPRAFEVATIKPSTTGRPGQQIQGERFTFGSGVLSSLIQYAYDVESFQISGGPGWTNQEPFDIQASAGSGIPLTETLAKDMLRALLAERFGLRMHQESKEMDVLRLVTNGTPKLTPSDRKTAGFLLARDGAETKGASITELARMLQRFGDRGKPIVDRTGLGGSYEFRLPFATTPNSATESPDVTTALREQLNLRLEPAKERLDVWVIDAAEHPPEN